MDSRAEEYISEKMRSALWLIKSIQQRQRTIYKVAKSIVRFQREFLDRGIEYLRPLGVAGCGRRYRHARINHQPRHHQQIHADAAGAVRIEIFLQQRPFDQRREILSLRRASKTIQGDHRKGRSQKTAFRPENRRNADRVRRSILPAARSQSIVRLLKLGSSSENESDIFDVLAVPGGRTN